MLVHYKNISNFRFKNTPLRLFIQLALLASTVVELVRTNEKDNKKRVKPEVQIRVLVLKVMNYVIDYYSEIMFSKLS